MGKPDFTKLEARLRNRKWPVMMADVKYNYGMSASKQLLSNPKDLAELVYNLLGKKKGSVYVRKNGKKTSLTAQCINGAQRSIEDVFVIAINYVPSLTYKKLQDILNPLVNGNEVDGVVKGQLFTHHYCSTVRREVHSPSALGCTESKVRTALGKNNIIF